MTLLPSILLPSPPLNSVARVFSIAIAAMAFTACSSNSSGDLADASQGAVRDSSSTGDASGDASESNSDANINVVDRPTLGVQRWDMYSGKGATQAQELGYTFGAQAFLKPAEWHHRAPFFCRRTQDVSGVNHPAGAGPLWFNSPYSQSRLQNAMDQEMRFADEAGVDYFIFNGPTRSLYPNGWELHNNLDVYIASSIDSEVEFVFALYGHEAIKYGRTKVNTMLDEIVGYMQHPKWHTLKDGRPLLPILWPMKFQTMLNAHSGAEKMSLTQFIGLIRSRVEAVGLPTPYIVGQEIVRTHNNAATLIPAGFDAVADYAPAYGGGTHLRDQAQPYDNATLILTNYINDNYVGNGPFVPSLTLQYYPWPRASGNTQHHYQLPEPGEIGDRIKAIVNLTLNNPEECDAQTIFMYSWNEHSEGGGLCPTMGTSPAYEPVRWKLDEVGAALHTFE